MTLFARHLEIVLRFSRSHVFTGIKTSKVFADDFLSFVTFDLFRAGIPRRYDPVWVEHIDRVFFDALYQETELLFARSKLLVLIPARLLLSSGIFAACHGLDLVLT